MAKSLGGYEPFYAVKWNANLRVGGAGQSKLWRKATDMPDAVKRIPNQRQEVIPMRRDNDLRAFMIDYLPIERASKEHGELLNRTF